jgi:hypothetical protein
MKTTENQTVSSLNATNVDAQMVDASVINPVNFSSMTPVNCHFEKMRRFRKIFESYDNSFGYGNGINIEVGDISDAYTMDENIDPYDAFRTRVILVTYCGNCFNRDGNVTYAHKTFSFLQYLFDDGSYVLQDLNLVAGDVKPFLVHPFGFTDPMKGYVYSMRDLKKKRYSEILSDLVKEGLEDFRYGDKGGLDDVL